MRITGLTYSIIGIIALLPFLSFPVFADHYSDQINDRVIMEILLKNVSRDAVNRENGVIISHIVDRGESWGSLASESGAEVWELMALNPEYSELHTGLEISLPEFPRWSQRQENKAISKNPQYKEAAKLMQAKDWKKAKKLYDRILKSEETLTAFYNRGIANFNSGKFTDANVDFSTVVSYDKFSLFPDAKKLAVKAYDAAEEKRKRREENIARIISGVAEAGLTALNAYNQINQAQSGGAYHNRTSAFPGVSPTSTPSGALAQQMSTPGYYQQQFQSLMNLTVNQVQQQEQAEYQMMRQNYLAFGYDLSFDEFRMLKAQAIAEMNGNSSGINVSEQSGNSNSTEPVVSSTRRCAYCNGTGRIVKDQSVPTFGLNDPMIKCNECGKSFHKSTGHAHFDCPHCRNGIPR